MPPERALASSVGASCTTHLSASCGACGRRLQWRAERFETDFMSRGGLPRSFRAQPARSTSKTCRQARGNRQQRARKSSSRLREPQPPWVCDLRCHRTSGGARPENYKALLRQVHLGSSASAQSWLPRASLSCTLWLLMKDAALLQLVGSTAQRQHAAARLLLPNRGSNPSIERTSNGGAHCFAPSRPVTPLAAAHVKR